ncbi:SWIM zinc finger family protein [Zavarzinella formosa]|uniref:SWIM zinc finger family protein n=1 Tax=Zavarzinella formosa TaxID=360055 RepID=UPI000309D9D3|nr:SWIM zinc finger family protein [Zavarzinella formosa]
MWWRDEPPRKKIVPKGGIKAQSKRGDFGENWWAKKWVSVIEGFHVGGRLQRGRTYARGGQVLSIDVTAGKVSAKVQGSMPKPYNVIIEVTKLTEAEWKKVTAALAAQAAFSAKLLAGELPPEVEQIFTDNKVSLFPAAAKDLKTNCSCPDYENPCKHIAAVYYLLAETFDRDPFLLFRLRGLDREALFAKLHAAEPVTSPAKTATPAPGEPLPTNPAIFWRIGKLPTDLIGNLEIPKVMAALPRRLGPLPFWRGEELFLESMETTYRRAAHAGATLAGGETLAMTEPALVTAATSRRKRV